MAVIPGIRGSGNWETNQKVGSWREGTLLLEPNGDAPLFALTSKLKEMQIMDTTHRWWTKALAQDTGVVTDVYEDNALANVYDPGDDYAAGTLAYVKMAAAVAADYIAGNVVRLHNATGDSVMTPLHGRVTSRVIAGAASYLVVKLLEADGLGTGDLSDCNRITLLGSAYAEGAQMPQSISYNPTERTNETQIFRRSLRQTRTSLRIKLRTGNQDTESKRETLQYHNMDVERSLFFGIPTNNVDDDTAMRIGTMGGIEYFIKTYASGNIFNYLDDAEGFDGDEWVVGGQDWLNNSIETLFRYGTSQQKICYCGPGALTAINRLVLAQGLFGLTTETTAYGIRVKRWETAHGDLLLVKHPLFNKYAEWYNGMIAVEPKNLRYCYIDDTTFVTDSNRDSLRGGGKIVRSAPGIDGLAEEFLTECTLEVAFPETFAVFKNLGSDNPL
jgi:hypothetical protein